MITINTQHVPMSCVDSSAAPVIPKSLPAQVAADNQQSTQTVPEARLLTPLRQSPDLAPVWGGDIDFDAKRDRLGSALAFLSDSNIDLLSRALIEFAAQSRKQALDCRLAAREAAKTQLEGQSQCMRDAASKIIAGAIASAVLQFVSATVSVGMSMGGLAKLNAGGEAARTTAEMYNSVGGGVKSAVDSSANAANSGAQASAKNDDAAGTERAALAEYKKGEADVAGSFVDFLREMLRAIIEFLKERNEAKAQKMQALTRL